jgi:predicted nucleic acid-binding protein
METRRRTRSRAPQTAFWDTSGIVPLCCFQAQTTQAHRTARTYARHVAWWATAVEAVSSFNRLQRERALTAQGRQQALARLEYLRRRWHEVQPSDELRDEAERLLGAHSLRAADALQLSAALTWCGRSPRGRCFVRADGNLASAAESEGFTVIRLL